MPINWFTVVAQIINFLILVWLLKRFLYHPILHAIDEREKGIANRLAEAEAKHVVAEMKCNEFQLKNESFDRDRAGLLKTATAEVKAERQKLLDEARVAADSLTMKRQEALRSEQRHLNEEILSWTRKEVFAIAKKTLADLATTGLEERMTDKFVQNLRAIPEQAKVQIATAFKTSNGSARVRSAFELSPAKHSSIENAINETFATDAKFQFETAPVIVSGIELVVDGQKVAWSVSDYLSMLEKSVSQLIGGDDNKEQVTPQSDHPVEQKPSSTKVELESHA